MAEKEKSNKIEITRIYDAPVKLVWEAWTDPAQVAKWWGPRGFTITTHSKDLKPGGHWNYTMHGPDGTDWENNTRYLEVEKYSKLVYDHGGNSTQPPLFRVTVNFIDLKGKTKMEMTMSLPSEEALENTKKIIKSANGNSTWDRLGEYLAKEINGKEEFLINRTFDAPIKTMFEMWTDPQHFSKWLAPTGFRMEFIRAEIRKGGSSFYLMTNDSSVTMYGKANYLEITPPHRIVYTQNFCDKDENITRHFAAPTWPETMLTTVTLAEEGSDKTRVTVQWETYGNVTPEELTTFVNAKAGMNQGWSGSFEKLEEYLNSKL